MAVLEWERVKESGNGVGLSRTKRAKVPGGWLVKSRMADGVGLTFVPDPDHTWE